jgi:aspartyl-tRNA(Asn)/glutamyl-tRNA(Gln) amidotransferase subunit C
MSISKEEVRYIAHLARLGLTADEIAHFQGQLEGILAYVDKLKTLDVSAIDPTAHVLDLKNVLRPDEPRPSLETEKALRIAPQRQNNFYKVPKVIE